MATTDEPFLVGRPRYPDEVADTWCHRHDRALDTEDVDIMVGGVRWTPAAERVFSFCGECVIEFCRAHDIEPSEVGLTGGESREETLDALAGVAGNLAARRWSARDIERSFRWERSGTGSGW